MVSDDAVCLQSHCLREKKGQKPRHTPMWSYSKLAARALCQLMHESFLKVSSEASGISCCLRQEDAPDRCNHRLGLLQQHLFFPPSARDKLCLYTIFYRKGMSISGFDFFSFCMHTVYLGVYLYPTWKLVLRNKYGPHLSLPSV